MPKVSIGLPVWNGEKYIRQAINSILSQTYKDFELVIGDNGSTDSTRKICEEYARKDKRVKFHPSDKNYGAAWNYNRVFNHSKGKYFKWASHDDLIAPTFLERCVKALDKNPRAVIAYPRSVEIDEKGRERERLSSGLPLSSENPVQRYKEYHKRFRRHLKGETKGQVNPIFGLLRSSALEKTPLIGSYSSSDEPLLGELALMGEFVEVPEYLFYRRYHPKMSVTAYKDYKKRIWWFDTQKKAKLQFPRWRLLLEHHKSIKRVKLSPEQKLRCYSQLLPWVLQRFTGLGMDLLRAAGQGLVNAKARLAGA